MLRVPTDAGILEIEEDELLAARVSSNYDPKTGILQVIIRWHDSGIVGEPRIDIKDGWAIVSIRKPEPIEESILDRANRRREEIASIKNSNDVAGELDE